MKTLFPLIILTSLFSLSACSARNWYNGMHASHEAACLKVPEGDYDACVKEANTSYDKYDKERQQLKHPPPEQKPDKKTGPQKNKTDNCSYLNIFCHHR